MENKNKHSKYTVLVIPAVVFNGIISGIFSVITSYFFKPIWDKIIVKILDAKQNYWEKHDES